MPRHVIEPTPAEGFNAAPQGIGASICRALVHSHCGCGVSWVTSYTTPDRKQVFCIHQAPSAEAIRRAADCNQPPASRVTEVRVLEPYCFK